MAWSMTRYGDVINLIPDGASDFDYSTFFPDEPEGLKIVEIQLLFTAANDKYVIRNGGKTSGYPIMFSYTTLDGSSIAKKFHGGLFKPYLEHDEQVYPAVTNSRIIIQTA